MRNDIQKNITELIPEMINLRHYIHSNPELSGEENSTALIIANVLEKFGYSVELGLAGTGVCAILDSGRPGKTIAFRAEMDALPIKEQTGAPYKSKIDGKMHACGHDGHMVTLLAVAGALKNCQEFFNGKIKFIFQPAEETSGSGAIEIVKQKVLENPKVDAIFTCHGTHRYETNVVATKVGCLLAGHDTFIIRIRGGGGYVSAAYAGCNPIHIGSLILQNLDKLKNNFTRFDDPVIMSVTQFQAGNAHNIIPREATLTGSVRTTSIVTQKKIQQEIIKTVKETTEKYNVEGSVDFQDSLPPLVNSCFETELVLKAAEQVLGENNTISKMDTLMAPEGFSAYLEKVPGCFFFIGNGLHRGRVHTSDYDFNDDTISIAAEILSLTAIEYLNSNEVNNKFNVREII